MTKTSKLRKTSKKLTKAEARAADLAAPSGSLQSNAVEAIGKLGDQPELRTISAAVVAAGLVGVNRRLLRAGVRMLLAHEIATLAKDLIKRRFDRTRPRSATTHVERKVKPGGNTAKEETSFPSGHSAGAVAVARALSRDYPDLQAPALASAGVVAAAQIPRLAHYPSDVAAGALLGVASEFVAGLVIPGARPRPRPRA